MDHSYEEIRSVVLDILSGREELRHGLLLNQYAALEIAVALSFKKREKANDNSAITIESLTPSLSTSDSEYCREVFWDLFRQGFITLGSDSGNSEYPFFKVSSFGKKILANKETYFIYDVSSYENIIREQIPEIDELTLFYLKEAMQTFIAGCILSSSVMLGVATEHTFMKLMETIDKNPLHSEHYKQVYKERSILRQFNKFRNILEQKDKTLPTEIKEDLDTNLSGILSIIRNFRNDSGHPTGKLISREQCYILLNLFIHYCKKTYQLIAYFDKKT